MDLLGSAYKIDKNYVITFVKSILAADFLWIYLRDTRLLRAC